MCIILVLGNIQSCKPINQSIFISRNNPQDFPSEKGFLQSHRCRQNKTINSRLVGRVRSQTDTRQSISMHGNISRASERCKTTEEGGVEQADIQQHQSLHHITNDHDKCALQAAHHTKVAHMMPGKMLDKVEQLLAWKTSWYLDLVEITAGTFTQTLQLRRSSCLPHNFPRPCELSICRCFR